MNKIYFSLALVLALTSCAKDRSVEDYQREKLQENLALYQGVAGTYTGIVTSSNDGSVMGAISLELRPETRVNQGSDGSSSTGTPVLVGNVRFLDQNVVNFSAPNGFYDPNTGLYSASIDIERAGAGSERAGAGSERVNLSGNLGNGELTGQVASQNYPEFGGKFKLVRNGGQIADLLREARQGLAPGNGGGNQITSFVGETQFSQTKKPVHIVVLKPSRGTAEDFLDLVSPIRNVQVSLNYSRSLNLLFPSVVFDRRQGYFTGLTSVRLDNQELRMTLDCNTNTQRIRCRHTTTGDGLAATSVGELAEGAVEFPPDSPEDRQSTNKTYVGKGRLSPEEKPRTMKLVVTRPARSKFQDLIELFFPQTEKYVQASFLFSENTSVSFINVKWDTTNGLLEGSLVGSGNGTYIAQMQCTDFYFTQQRKPFTCLYWTNRSPTIQIQFNP